MNTALLTLFRRNFPTAVRSDEEAWHVLSDPDNHVLQAKDASGALIGASVIHQNTLLLLCVDAPHRRQGIGSRLLADSEAYVRAQGFPEITVGAGKNYLLPGVPTHVMPGCAPLPARLVGQQQDDAACAFFRKRGYTHAWGDMLCFDMSLSLDDFAYAEHAVGDRIDDVAYRIAAPGDRATVCEMMDAACSDFTVYYADESLYQSSASTCVLLAEKAGQICGSVLVILDEGEPRLGALGCIGVAPPWRGQRIASQLVLLGTRLLKERGMRAALIGYTYSSLEKLYGLAGYEICRYYMIARKPLGPREDNSEKPKEAE